MSRRGSQAPRRVFTLLVGIFAAVALLLILIAGGLVLHTRSFLEQAASATGTVVELVGRESCSTDDDHHRTCSTVYAPRVRFTTADGREILYLSATATSPPSYAEGEQVEIRYRPGNPYDARISSYVDLWLAPTIVGGIGLVFAVVVVILVAASRATSARYPAASSIGDAPAEEVEPDEVEPTEPNGWQDPGTLR